MYTVYGRVAQRIRRLTTNQEIPGSNPGVVEFFLSGIILRTNQYTKMVWMMEDLATAGFALVQFSFLFL